MSNLDAAPVEAVLDPAACAGPELELLEPRTVVLGRTTTVRRLLPHRDRRMVGAWCFVDHYGPEPTGAGAASGDGGDGRRRGMWVPPHPHTGLQTVSWLLEGEVLHRDSLGTHALLRPGHLGLMTSGRGIAHSEESPVAGPSVLHGAQLWLALPDAERHRAPSWQHLERLPTATVGAAGEVRVLVLVGSLGVGDSAVTSPADVHTPLVGAQVSVDRGAAASLDVDPAHEHAVLALTPGLVVAGVALEPGRMLDLGVGRAGVDVAAADGPATGGPATGLLLGGEPFDEQLVMWWNFVGRSHDEIVAMRREWQASTGRYGRVDGFDGRALEAPALPTTRLRPRGRAR